MEMHLPWLEFAILAPLLCGLWCLWIGNGRAHLLSTLTAGLTLLSTLGAWQDFLSLHAFSAHDHWYFARNWLGEEMLVIDELSAPLLSLTAVTYLVTLLATVRTKSQRFSYAGNLFSLSITVALLSSRESWLLVGLLALSCLPVYVELRARGKSTRVFVLHMGLFVALLLAGWGLLVWHGPQLLAVALLMLAVLIRCGTAPLHCWMTDLFENASFGTALLFCTPMSGTYAAMHFVFPFAPAWALRTIAVASMTTALYAAAMTLVQREARRFFAYLFLSVSSLVLVGLEVSTPQGLAGALSMWLAAGLSLTGFGLVLRGVEARLGRVPLNRFHGLFGHVPMLAGFFLFTGLATVGFPGTFGFFASELLIDSTVRMYPTVGLIVVLATTLNGIAVFRTYLRIFTGTKPDTSISIQSQPPERFAILIMGLLILGGGLLPQPMIASRFSAAEHLFEQQAAARDRLATPAIGPASD